MSRRSGDWESDAATGLVGLGILILIFLLFWWFKGLAIVVKAFQLEPHHRGLWASLAALVLFGILGVLSQGNAVLISLTAAALLVHFGIAQSIVSSSSRRLDSARSLEDVIRIRW